MSKNLESPTKLTEFAPLQPEEKPQSVGQFISKFFKLSKSPITDDNCIEEGYPNCDNILQESLPAWALDTSQDSSGSTRETVNDVYSVDVNEGRSLPNVLKRISNLLALKSTNLQDYADTELKQYWMPDSVSKECYECCEKFTTFKRRHHCRVCGQIFCSQCCSQQIPGKIFGCTGDLRVCTYCCKIVLSYLSSDIQSDLTADLKLLQENLQTKFGYSPSSPCSSPQDNITQNLNTDTLEGNKTQRRKISVGYQEEMFATGGSVNVSHLSIEEKSKALRNSSSLRNLYEEISQPTTGISLGTHKYRLRTYEGCFLGSELVDWLICQQKSNSRVQAVAICQAFLEGGYIQSLPEPTYFVDGYALYRPGDLMSPDLPPNFGGFDMTTQEEPIWVQQIPQESSTTDSESEQIYPMNKNRAFLKSCSSYMLDLNVVNNTVYISRPPTSGYNLASPDTNEMDYHKFEGKPEVRTSEHREFVPEEGWHNASTLREENGEHLAYGIFKEIYELHEQTLLKQLLSTHGLSFTWSDVVLPLVHDVVNVIRPDKNHNAEDLDIRHYIQLKKLTGGLRNETTLVNGVVFSKNVAHKGMSVNIENPRILLLQCSIVYQRTEGRLMSLEPVLMQEHEYLRHVAARIIAFQPDIVIVQRNVSRLAQDFLRDSGVTLVHNVKASVLERLARCVQADLVTAVDAHIGRPRLGTCKRFYLKSFDIDRGGVKTLMFFEGLPMPHLGSTILLRGGAKNELARLKKVIAFLIFATYNWRLEKSFLMDEYAQPPTSKYEFFDDSKETSPTMEMHAKGTKSSRNKYVYKDDESDVFERTQETSKTTEDRSKITTLHLNDDKNLFTQEINDFSDPLHSSFKIEDDILRTRSKQVLSVADLPFSNNFRKTLDDTVLCISPYLMFMVPYLETEVGKKCKLRKFFSAEIYYSAQFDNNIKTKLARDVESNGFHENRENCKLKPIHPFLTTKITTSVETNEIQNLLAHFRACGSRYEKRDIICNKENDVQLVTKAEFDNAKLDVLDPCNHQRLAVLFCSFSNESPNAPAFCVNPWVVFMDFYGRNDIPLGCFLEKYCFRPTYTCPSKNCDVPMVKHIRRFVHYSGCVSISLNNFDNEFPEENIVMWTWCTKCQSVSPVVPMSADTWSFSFGKYLESKFHGNIYSRRGNLPCSHSLHHDHYQYFGYKNSVASFKYTSVDIWEISLPPTVIDIQYDIEKQHLELIDEMRIMSQKGHDIFSLILEKITSLPFELECSNFKQMLSKEQIQFKQKIEEVQLKLTSPTIDNKDFDVKVIYSAYWKLSDALVQIKRLIVEIVDTWNSRLSEAIRKRDNDKKRDKGAHSDLESPTTVENKPFPDSGEFSGIAPFEQAPAIPISKIKSLDHDELYSSPNSGTSPKGHQRSQSDGTVMSQNEELLDGKKETDRKIMKALLSQLLPSASPLSLIPNPFNNQDHYTLPSGVKATVIVSENDLSSIIAYALNSYDYKKLLDDAKQSSIHVELSPSPITKRKNQVDRDKNDMNDDKNSRLLGFLRNRDSKTDLNCPSPNSVQQDMSNQPQIQSPNPEVIDDSKRGKKLHIDVIFEDTTCNFLCRIYFAEKFASLRTSVLSMGEEMYIRSLAKSVIWNARGGKSGSAFTKTADDRFVLKETSKSEVSLFLESSQNYFSYMQKCHTTGQPTLLGKIVGIYQIIFKNNTNGQQLRKHLLVMENLFYNRKVSQKFDLKGSVRNRLAIPDNQEGEIVLLDENLLKMTCESPLYILPHSKAVLTCAIQNDTEFLSSQAVMDYSLLVGLDSENKELVLGIIDYIRTFTWDKRLETMVKKTGILGGQGKQPTIVSPTDYQARFIEAMHKYFLEVPDHWAGLGKELEF